ncbi:MAG: hypothetical protein WCD43_04140 [Candidatus Acidiferrales bacterium]
MKNVAADWEAGSFIFSLASLNEARSAIQSGLPLSSLTQMWIADPARSTRIKERKGRVIMKSHYDHNGGLEIYPSLSETLQ